MDNKNIEDKKRVWAAGDWGKKFNSRY